MIEDLKQVRDALGQMELDLSYYVHLATKAKTKNKWIDVEVYKVEMSIDSIRKQIATLDSIIADHIPDASKMVVPDGYKLAPIEPTEAMRRVGVEIANATNKIVSAYKAMLSAAPTPPHPEKLDVEALTCIAWDVFYNSNKPAPYNQMKDVILHLAATYDFVRKV